FTQLEAVPDSGPAAGVGENQVRAAIVIPQWARINKPLARLEQMRLAPWSARIVGGDDINPFIPRWEKDPASVRVIANGRRPDAAAALYLCVARIRQILQRVPNERPAHQIARVQNRQPGRAVETRCSEKVIVSHADRIGIGIVGEED